MEYTKIVGKYNTAKVYLPIEEIDEVTTKQIYEMCNNPAYAGDNSIKIMPDCHAGKGSVIGFTMKFGDVLDPRCVGSDIGCGILTSKIKFIDETTCVNDLLKNIDIIIQDTIPMGQSINESCVTSDKQFYLKYLNVNEDFVKNFCKRINIAEHKFYNSIGTLGGGNHFIELGKCTNNIYNDYYLSVHTGSRNLGVKVCNYHTNVMLNTRVIVEIPDLKSEINKIKSQYSGKNIEIQINKVKLTIENIKKHINNNMYYLSGISLKNYLDDMKFAQKYAALNRIVIINRIIKQLNANSIQVENERVEIDSIHNYIDDEYIRKGAISAKDGELLIIPLNMKDGIILGTGKNNPNWNYSAPHGAGRILSRTKSKDSLSLDNFKQEMSGIYSTCINESTLDESPMAYKDKNLIINAIKDTVEILDFIKPILNIKA